MKVGKLDNYVPEYPSKGRRTVKAGVIAAAAVITAGAAIGCVGKPQLMGDYPADYTETVTDKPAQTPDITDEPMLEGEPAVDETEFTERPEETLLTTGLPTLSPDPEETVLMTPGVPLTAEPTKEP